MNIKKIKQEVLEELSTKNRNLESYNRLINRVMDLAIKKTVKLKDEEIKLHIQDSGYHKNLALRLYKELENLKKRMK